MKIIIGIAALLLLLGGAAFVGGRWLGNLVLPSDHQDIIVSDSGDEVTTLGMMIKKEPADEMPNASPDVAGLFVQREDNRFFIGTGNLSGVLVEGDPRGAARWEYHHDGPVVELVITHNTLIYRDDTFQQFTETMPSDPIQQVLTPCTAEEIDEHSTISAWGEKRGDRMIAETVVFYLNP